MKAVFDRKANALSIDLVAPCYWDDSEKVALRTHVAIAGDKPVNVELLFPDLGIDEPLRVAAERFDLDAEALIAAARAAIAAPDREVTLEVGVRIAA